ncbi:MAG: hypothetical protein IPN33_11995 [Saprospiraceae bacterium]|nr:hypothetical protein [Saprospiraceae bacterium]
MKKILNILLILTSLFGYIEWGKDQHSFLFQMEYELIFGAARNASNFAHPIILLPLLGQLTILFTIFQKTPNRWLTFIGLACLSTIMLLIFVAGIASLNYRIILSAIPFLVTGVLVLGYNRNRAEKASAK